MKTENELSVGAVVAAAPDASFTTDSGASLAPESSSAPATAPSAPTPAPPPPPVESAKTEAPPSESPSPSRTERVLESVDLAADSAQRKLAQIKEKYRGCPDIPEAMLEETILLVGQEVIQKTAVSKDLQARTAAARLMLERSAQKLAREKLRYYLEREAREEQARKDKAAEAAKPKKAISRETLDQIKEELDLL